MQQSLTQKVLRKPKWFGYGPWSPSLTCCKKLGISAGGDRKKLRRVSRMRYHDLTKVAGIKSSGLFSCVPSMFDS
jgi:hypothetical protein